MKCPRCSKELVEMESKNVAVDVCYNGCGGIWFDWLELKKVDEKHEADPAFLDKLSKSSTQKLDLSEKIMCPTCDNMPMMRRFNSIKKQVEVDECAKCGGIWLDAGELIAIHAEFETEEEKRAATEEFITDTFSATMQKEKTNVEQMEKVGKALRFIAPSTYVYAIAKSMHKP